MAFLPDVKMPLHRNSRGFILNAAAWREVIQRTD